MSKLDIPEVDRKLLLPLDVLQRELEGLEAGSFDSLTDDELLAKIRLIHGGFGINAPYFDKDTEIYRAVVVRERPKTISRISHPPVDRVSKNGRLNKTGEVMFYGSFGQIAACLEECNWQVGQFIAVSGWLTNELMMFNHLGYSAEVIAATNTARELPNFAKVDDDNERNKLIRAWQARVFTQQVPDGQEHLYRLPIALKTYALGELVQNRPGAPSLFSGVIYPSIALHMLSDNVAMLPSEADAKLDLFEVVIMTLDSVETVKVGDSTETRKHMKFYDYARADADGNLIWGQRSQIDFPGLVNAAAFKPRRLMPQSPGKHVGFTQTWTRTPAGKRFD